MMALSVATADTRARFLREMRRLAAVPVLGGPFLAVRDGVLLAWAPNCSPVEVDERLLAELGRLPDGAGCERVAEVLTP